MTTITIGQRKGGNGKSTSALNLAHAFALRGKRLLVIDLDDQKNSTSAIETAKPVTHTVEDLLLPHDEELPRGSNPLARVKRIADEGWYSPPTITDAGCRPDCA